MTGVCGDPPINLDICDDEANFRETILSQVDGYGGAATGAGIDMMGPSGDLDRCTVTNRNASGPGSLPWCVSSGRWVNFDPTVFPENPTANFQAGGNLALLDPIPVPQTIFLDGPLVVPSNVTIEAAGACVRIANLNGGDTVRVSGNNVILYNLEVYGHGPRTFTPGNGAGAAGSAGSSLGSTLNIAGSTVWASRMKVWQGDQHALRVSGGDVTVSHSQIWNIAGSAGYITGGPFTSHHNWWPDSMTNTPWVDGAVAHQYSDFVMHAGQDAFDDRWRASIVTNGGCLTSESNQFTPRSFCDSLDCYVNNQGGNLATSGNIFLPPLRPDFFTNINQQAFECNESGTCPPIPYPYTADPPCTPPEGFVYNGSPQWPVDYQCDDTGWIDGDSRTDLGVSCP